MKIERDDETYENENGAYVKINRKHKFLSLAVFLLFVTTLLVTFFGSDYSSTTGVRGKNYNSVIMLKNNVFSEKLDSDIKYSFRRNGYAALSYFSDTETPKYKFLDDYDGVIEPSSTMIFHLYEDDSFYQEKTVKMIYKICLDTSTDEISTATSSLCKEGTYTKTSSGEITTSELHFDCAINDVFTVNVKHIDNEVDGKIIRAKTGKALCIQVKFTFISLQSKDYLLC